MGLLPLSINATTLRPTRAPGNRQLGADNEKIFRDVSVGWLHRCGLAPRPPGLLPIAAPGIMGKCVNGTYCGPSYPQNALRITPIAVLVVLRY